MNFCRSEQRRGLSLPLSLPLQFPHQDSRASGVGGSLMHGSRFGFLVLQVKERGSGQRTPTVRQNVIENFKEAAELVKKDFGSIDILVHLFANGTEIKTTHIDLTLYFCLP
ncbi:hypothetical protein L2E82_40009 [Cichorium intybus]|uniref:Uncharacterized protein n=1 Tax=Cichorium intybus TaxID=13427 RepID=A0ACB9AK64_CICIN|nr:hypothetical protein L2E82_40009 [Cichorium intybus]